MCACLPVTTDREGFLSTAGGNISAERVTALLLRITLSLHASLAPARRTASSMLRKELGIMRCLHTNGRRHRDIKTNPTLHRTAMPHVTSDDELAGLKAKEAALDAQLAAAERAGHQADKDGLRAQLAANQYAQGALLAAIHGQTSRHIDEARMFEFALQDGRASTEAASPTVKRQVATARCVACDAEHGSARGDNYGCLHGKVVITVAHIVKADGVCKLFGVPDTKSPCNFLGLCGAYQANKAAGAPPTGCHDAFDDALMAFVPVGEADAETAASGPARAEWMIIAEDARLNGKVVPLCSSRTAMRMRTIQMISRVGGERYRELCAAATAKRGATSQAIVEDWFAGMPPLAPPTAAQLASLRAAQLAATTTRKRSRDR
jgi:hypothetical protein